LEQNDETSRLKSLLVAEQGRAQVFIHFWFWSMK